MCKKVIIFWILIFLFIPSVVMAGDWYTLETDNFIINFEKNKEEVAAKTANIAEEVHNNLTSFLDYTPKEKTYIILRDNFDQSNGWANPTYFNRINIYLTPPSVYSGLVGYYDSWLRLLITHEYTHILHLNINQGSSKVYRQLLGKIPLVSTPNQMQPWWLIEGYATYAETQYSSGGRGDNDIYNMYLRKQAVHEGLYDLDKVNGKYDLNDWPRGGKAIYIYGLSFCTYLVEEYGEEKLVELSHRFAESPYKGINYAFRKIYKKEMGQVYNDWKSKVEDYSFKLSQERNDKGVERLTQHGGYTINPSIISEDGNVAYFHYGQEFPSLKLIDKSGKKEQLAKGYSPAGGRPALAPDKNKLAYAKLGYIDTGHYYYDLYIYKLSKGEEKRITRGERAYSPVWIDDKHLLYLTNKKGTTNLKVINISTDKKEILWEGNQDMFLSHLSPGPDRKRIVLSIWQKGKRDIYIYNIEDRELNALFIDDFVNIFPTWSPDGEYIIFSSDRGGNFDLYAFQLNTGDIFQVTNLFSGALAPTISKNDIVFSVYGDNGYNLFKKEYNPDNWNKVENLKSNQMVKLETFNNKVDSNHKLKYKSNKYNPLMTMQPRFWIPTLTYSYYGEKGRLTTSLLTGGIDSLEEHWYQFQLKYDSYTPGLEYDFQYKYDQNQSPYIDINLNISSVGKEIENIGRIKENKLDFLITYPLLKDSFYDYNVSVGLDFQELKDVNGNSLDHNIYYKTSWQGNNLTGWDNIFNESEFNLKFKWLAGDINNSKSNLVLKNTMTIADKNQLAARIYLANNNIDDYHFTDMDLIRNSAIYDMSCSEVGVVNLEYRRELRNIESGYDYIPLFFDDLNWRIFYDGGIIGKENNIPLQVIGTEMGLEVEQFYGLTSVEFVMGISRELSQSDNEFYIKLGRHF